MLEFRLLVFLLRVSVWFVGKKLVEFCSARLLLRFPFALRPAYGSTDGASGRQDSKKRKRVGLASKRDLRALGRGC